MKKIVLVCAAILAITFVVLSVLDNGEYALERSLWKAKQDFQAIAQDPKAAPPAKYAVLAKRYQKLIDRHDGSKYLPLLYVQKGKVYFMQEDFAGAREVFQEEMKRFSDDERLQVEMLLLIGSTYEREGKPDEALAVYKKVQTGFPGSDWDIAMPLYIADFYLREGQVDKHREALADAVAFYQAEMDKGDEARRLKAMRSLVAAYLAQEEWYKAIEILKKALFLIAEQPQADPRQALVLINAISRVSVVQLKNPDPAIGIVQAFLAKYPKHPGQEYLKKLLAGLQGKGQAENDR